MQDRKLKDLVLSLPDAIALFQVRRILKPIIRTKSHFVAHLVIEDAAYQSVVESMLEVLLAGKSSGGITRYRSEVKVARIALAEDAGDTIRGMLHLRDTVVFLYERTEDIPPAYLARADVHRAIGKPDLAIVRQATRLFSGERVGDDDATLIASSNYDDLLAAFRRGRSLACSLELLRRSPEPHAVTKIAELPQNHVASGNGLHSLGLDGLFGYGIAIDIGLQLARDLSDYKLGKIGWESVDRGILLYGPPGTGKTQFARALAVSSGVPLIAASYAMWGKGHQGDFLKAMNKTFEDAVTSAPCILAIDELDSFTSDREDSSEYMRQVNNGFLEHLDGLKSRDGVVIVATMNRVNDVYPPIPRAGRIETHIAIQLPDAAERRGIFEQHVGSALPETCCREFEMVTEGYTGADLAKLARDVRREARLSRVEIGADLIRSSLPALADVPQEKLVTSAVHEAGHVIVGLALGRELDYARVAERYVVNRRYQPLGGAWFTMPPAAERNRAHLEEDLLIALGGIAAELEVFGVHGDGAGGAEESDLVRATNLATRIEAVHAMGQTLVSEVYREENLSRLRRENRTLWGRIDRFMKRQLRVSRRIVAEHKDTVIKLASHLAVETELTGDDVQRFLASRGLEVHPFNHPPPSSFKALSA